MGDSVMILFQLLSHVTSFIGISPFVVGDHYSSKLPTGISACISMSPWIADVWSNYRPWSGKGESFKAQGLAEPKNVCVLWELFGVMSSRFFSAERNKLSSTFLFLPLTMEHSMLEWDSPPPAGLTSKTWSISVGCFSDCCSVVLVDFRDSWWQFSTASSTTR